MKIIVITILSCALAAITAGAQLNFTRGNTIDLDSITPGDKAHGSVVVRNDGTEPLSIIKIFSECGCTVPEYRRTPIAPGDTSVISVTFDSTGRSHGRFTKAIRIRTDSGQITPVIVKGVIRKVYRK
ncbi:MAG: DUF1573 domain-containing protein [Muribaculaceae bacterium]|nr:DUF1573 domain-containing protein [Muribaculaceae bacterium]